MDLSLSPPRPVEAADAAPPGRAAARLRLGLGSVVLLGSVLCFVGTSWDIQWHSLIGRDRTLIPPHLVMLTGVTLGGLAAIASVLVETRLVRAGRAGQVPRASFAGLFRAPLGAFVAGFGALCAAVAFPLDAYWHSLYGIDVAIWAPFHIMILVGMAVAALGGAYLLVSGTRLAASLGATTAARAGHLATVVALAATMNILMFVVLPAAQGSAIPLGPIRLGVFPALDALTVTTMLIAATTLVPHRWAAVEVVLASLALVAVMAVFVPPATGALAAVEQQTFRNRGPGTPSLVMLEWPLTPLLAAVLVDVVTRAARRGAWTLARLAVAGGAACLVACVPMSPVGLLTVLAAALAGSAAPVLRFALGVPLGPGAAVAWPLALALGGVAAVWGVWFGLRAGWAPAVAEREA